MVRQPVTITKKGKTVTKDALYYYGTYRGFDNAGTEIGAEFHEGWYLKPKLRFQLKDPGTHTILLQENEDVNIRQEDQTFEHYIFLPENKADRVKFLNDLMKNSPGTTPEGVAYGAHLSYRLPTPDNSHVGSHGGSFDWQTFCELSLRELGEIQQTGYYKEEKTGLLKDSKGRRVKFDDNTGKMDAVK